MSYVRTLNIDENTRKNPTWEDVEVAISSLDGRSVTLVALAQAPPLGPPEGDCHVAVGGGRDERYVVYMTEDNLQFWNLEDPAGSTLGGPVLMTIGGQEGDYDSRRCVPKSWAMSAAREYFEHGTRAKGLPWTKG